MDDHSQSSHQAQAREQFDAWSESQTFERLRPWLVYQQTEVLNRIDWSRVRSFLDVACGSGWAVIEAARRLDGRSGTVACGCDISVGMLCQRASAGGSGTREHFLVASAQSLPYRRGSFDAAMCTAAFHHFPAPQEALAEFRRVLRPGGTLVIAETCRDLSLGTWMWDRFHRWFEPGHVKYYLRKEIRELISSSGFAHLRATDFNPRAASTRKLFGRFTVFEATAP